MKKGLKFLSILSAVALSMGVCLSACSQKTAPEHDHIYDNGVVTTEPTCHSEGVKTFTCTVENCGVTRTEPIAKTPHKWDSGEVTTQPKCNAFGVKTFKCTNEGCIATKTGEVAKSDHHYVDDTEVEPTPADFFHKGEKQVKCADCGNTKTETIPAQADFASDFYADTEIAETAPWHYGYLTEFDQANADGQAPQELDVSEGKWSKDGVEIAKGTVSVAAGKTAVIAYKFGDEADGQQLQADIIVTFKSDNDKAFKAYIGDGGEGLTAINKDSTEAFTKDIEYKPADPIDIAGEGSAIVLYLDNANASETVSGNLTFTLKPHCLHQWEEQGTVTKPATTHTPGTKTFKCVNDGCDKVKTEEISTLTVEHLISDFDADFSDTLAGSSKWKVGNPNYQFEPERFEFAAITGKNDDQSGLKNDDPFMEVKGDWAAIGSWVGLEYTFDKAYKGKFDFNLISAESNKFAVRYAIQHGSAATPEWGADGSSIALSKDITVDENDKLYILINRENTSTTNQCYFSLIITGEEYTPEPEVPAVANFAEDFDKADNNWVYGYSSNYDFNNNSFTFTALDKNQDGNYQCKDEGTSNNLEIKKDFVLTEYAERDLAVGYKVPAGYSKLKFAIDFTGNNAETRIAARVVRVRGGSDYSATFLDKGENQQNWQAEHEVDVQENDIVYVILFPKPETGYKQGKLQIIVTGEEVEPAEPFAGANFADDFHGSDVADSNWEYGYVNYGFGDNAKALPANDGKTDSFDYHAATCNNDESNLAWTAEQGVEIKKGWLSVGWQNQANKSTIVYNMKANASVDIHLAFKGTDGKTTYLAVRIVVLDSENNFRLSHDTFGAQSNTKSDWTDDWSNVELHAGDKIYFMFFIEDNAPTDNTCGDLTLTIAEHA